SSPSVHLQTSQSPGVSLPCTMSPSSADQVIEHLQLPSRSCAYSYSSLKKHVLSVPTAAADGSFQFIFRHYHCRLHLLAPLPERMSCNCSSFF
uniref:Uncharacterized protein n=1 Tax=Buteo japonicus TaxID=224669 RepID=A0A8C0BS53_9AVES